MHVVEKFNIVIFLARSHWTSVASSLSKLFNKWENAIKATVCIIYRNCVKVFLLRYRLRLKIEKQTVAGL